MIKIIKNTMTEPIECTCPVCKSVFSYTFDEVRRDENTTIMGMKTVNRYVICPVCKTDIDRNPVVKLEER